MNKHMDTLLELENLKRESANGLKEFVDKVQGAVRALKNLGMPIEHWDAWLIRVVSSRLDGESRKLWEAELSSRDVGLRNETNDQRDDQSRRYQFPKFTELIDFIERRVETLSMSVEEHNSGKRCQVPPVKSYGWSRRVMHASFKTGNKIQDTRCPMCAGPHTLYACRKFQLLKPTKRREEVRRLRKCYNCFGNHRVDICRSNTRCARCTGRHHTSLHFDGTPSVGVSKPESKTEVKLASVPSEKVSAAIHTIRKVDSRSIVLLATARIGVSGPIGQTVAKAFIDAGSNVSMITEDLAQRLRLFRRDTDVSLTGLGGKDAGIAKSAAEVTVHSLVEPSISVRVELLVQKRLTDRLPSRNLQEVDLSEFSGLQLADPHFDKSESVDIIIGADIEGHFAKPGLQKSKSSALIARNTSLGWVFSGPPPEVSARRAELSGSGSAQSFHLATGFEIQEFLPKFWELEEVPPTTRGLSVEEEFCEKQFAESYRQDSEGRFIVYLPLRDRPSGTSAETRRIAMGSLASAHRKFMSKPELGKAYVEFMKQYEALGHMSQIPASEVKNDDAWYLPHHAVMQDRPEGTKIRVVFDAARKAASRNCLNDFLMPGPPLQGDLGLILLNWRRYKFVFSADIVKMFRQIHVANNDRDCQRIVWSPSINDTPVDYRLNTVTYGTACAPFLAIRTLQEIAAKGISTFPLGVKCLVKNTYVDDTFAGSNDLARAIMKRDELIALLHTARIELDKWSANVAELLPSEKLGKSGECHKRIGIDSSVKALGVTWKPNSDQFFFDSAISFNAQEVVTKRVILSKIARLFDPLGWLAPVTILAKIMLQDLWILKSDWDVPVPDDVRIRWTDYCRSMSALTELNIDRWLGTITGGKYQLHGFSDASVRAFAAVVYLRVETPDGRVRVVLVAAKSKVAPVKTVTIPNLELCGAVLLTKLVIYLRKLDFFKELSVHLWSDSQIVLAWLSKYPTQWKAFVANRVSLIQTELPEAVWRHVSTKENPADIATRGMLATNLITETLWWHGPRWLSLNSEKWEYTEVRRQCLVSRTVVERCEPKIMSKFGQLPKLWRVFASLQKLLRNWRRRREGLQPLWDPLTAEELEEAKVTLIRLAQLAEYQAEFDALRRGQSVARSSQLRALNPILDGKREILLVGGRLERSELSHTQKHPPILPKGSALSRLYIRFAHVTCLHGGPALTGSIVMQYVWIVGQRQLIKTAIKKCVACQRSRPRLAQQIMGDLPASRVTPARPFTRTGLDYAGPFLTLTREGRGQRSYKCWIALFICFTTRAIHLEVVRDLTTAAFLTALRRFMSRRGRCRYLYSDNASTFKGAAAELSRMFTKASDFYGEVAATLANDGVTWKFIPPTTPHYGGLWEAGVKSVKHHLRRAIGDTALTFEEFSTVLAEIEVCLNSRPLCPLSGDIEDLDALTPFHLLIGEASALLPDLDLEGIRENRLDRYQRMQRIRDQFWRKWSTEYLHHLQERGKWREAVDNFKVGALVLVADDRYPPSKWPMGRILEVYPGPDGHVRVVSVKTVNGIFKRHIARLSPLYLDEA